MSKFNPSINWPKRKVYSSSNAYMHPYLLKRVEHPVSDKDFFINSCHDTFDLIAKKRKAIKANGGKTTGLCELKEI